MNGKARVALVALTVMALLSFAFTLSRESQERRGPGSLDGVRAGQWIRLKGEVQDLDVVRCTDVRVLMGDFLDNDWSVRGTIVAVGPGRRLTVGPFGIDLTDDAIFENTRGKAVLFSDLRVGALVEAEGSYRKDGTLLADEVDEPDDAASRPGSDRQIEILARVEGVNLVKRQIVAMGTVFQVNDDTQVKGVLH